MTSKVSTIEPEIIRAKETGNHNTRGSEVIRSSRSSRDTSSTKGSQSRSVRHRDLERRGTQEPKRINSQEYLEREGYNIGRVLGEGSYCKVRLATRGTDKMAVKIITRATQSKDFVERFLPRELDILRKVKHKNIIQVNRIVNFPHKVYIFMDYVERGDLLDYIRARGHLSETEARYYFKQLVSAVQYLHSMMVAHRDLKCENILITDDDDIKIIDFGFCRSTVDKNGRRVLSSTYCGSTAYASPEVLQGIPYNPMMYDVWSLGCVLYIMITGSMPFDDSNVPRMVKSQINRNVKFPRSDRFSTEVKSLVRHMLEPDITKRATMVQVSRNKWISPTRPTLTT